VADTRVWLLTADEAAALRDAGSAAEQDEVMRPIRDRLVAEALTEASQRIAGACGHLIVEAGQVVGVSAPELCPSCTPEVAVIYALAAEYREGKR
jgi:hypothetical protein